LSIQAQIIELLRDLRAKHDLSYMFISHDLKVVKALCHNVIVMQHGNVIETGLTQHVLDHPQTDYTRRLVNAAFNVLA
jgi:peptide/nickel transport system ATP-binding protein